MLSREENELVTRTGPGTPLGGVMRRYWIPAALSSEVREPDCPPVRVKLLGEELVAFRDTRGRIGLVDGFCAHRRASLFLGRNEECGLRCVYHGWKYDVDGNCLDMPNEPAESTYRQKIRLKAYPTVELGGIVWAYMGAPDRRAALPAFEWTRVPESHRCVSKTWQECNWLQALEGGIDSSHSSFLHRALTSQTARYGIQGYRVSSAAPTHEVDFTDYGLLYASIRSLGEEGEFVRVYHYMMPFHTFFARQIGQSGELKLTQISGHIFVPMDDENCMVYNLTYSFGDEPLVEKDVIEQRRGRGPGEQTADFRKVRNRDNDWLIDRRAQRTETFTGIEGINTQDHAVQESMGRIVDRTREHLGPSDRAVIAARRLLIQAVETVKDGGDPPGMTPSAGPIRAVEKVLPQGARWRDELKDEIYPDGGGERGAGLSRVRAVDVGRRERSH